jgi:hypothetical protein
VFGPEFLDRQRCLLRTFAQFRQPALQPDRRALGGVEAGIELVGKIGVGIGFGDGFRQSRIRRLIAKRDDVASSDTIRLDLVLQFEDRVAGSSLLMSPMPGMGALGWTYWIRPRIKPTPWARADCGGFMNASFWSSLSLSTTTAASRVEVRISIWLRMAESVCMVVDAAEISSTILFRPSSISTLETDTYLGGVVCK